LIGCDSYSFRFRGWVTIYHTNQNQKKKKNSVTTEWLVVPINIYVFTCDYVLLMYH
jgi:hypothetical protein